MSLIKSLEVGEKVRHGDFYKTNETTRVPVNESIGSTIGYFCRPVFREIPEKFKAITMNGFVPLGSEFISKRFNKHEIKEYAQFLIDIHDALIQEIEL